MLESEDFGVSTGAEGAPNDGISFPRTAVEKETKDMKARTETSFREVEAAKLTAEARTVHDTATPVAPMKVEEDKENSKLAALSNEEKERKLGVDTDLKERKAEEAKLTATTMIAHDTATPISEKKVENDMENSKLAALVKEETVKQKDFQINPAPSADAIIQATQWSEFDISRFSSVETVVENSTVKSEISAGEGIDQGKIAEEEVRISNFPFLLVIYLREMFHLYNLVDRRVC